MVRFWFAIVLCALIVSFHGTTLAASNPLYRHGSAPSYNSRSTKPEGSRHRRRTRRVQPVRSIDLSSYSLNITTFGDEQAKEIDREYVRILRVMKQDLRKIRNRKDRSRLFVTLRKYRNALRTYQKTKVLPTSSRGSLLEGFITQFTSDLRNVVSRSKAQDSSNALDKNTSHQCNQLMNYYERTLASIGASDNKNKILGAFNTFMRAGCLTCKELQEQLHAHTALKKYATSADRLYAQWCE